MLDRIGKLEGEVGILKSRLDGVEEWEAESRRFHVEMRSNWDQLLGAQTAKEALDKERHRSNTSKLNLMMAVLALATLVILGMGTLISYAALKHESLGIGHVLQSFTGVEREAVSTVPAN